MHCLLIAAGLLGQSPQSITATPQASYEAIEPRQVLVVPQASYQAPAAVRMETRSTWEIEPGRIRLPRFRIRRDPVAVLDTAPPPQSLRIEPRPTVQWTYPEARYQAASAPGVLIPAPAYNPPPAKSLPAPSKQPAQRGPEGEIEERLTRIEQSIDRLLDERVREAVRETDDTAPLPPLPKTESQRAPKEGSEAP